MIYKRMFKAKICDHFETEWLRETAKDEGYTVEEAAKHYGGAELKAFAARIEGQIVDMIGCVYDVGSIDYFEAVDNNFVMHPLLFVELGQAT